jgi:hypothetical protein
MKKENYLDAQLQVFVCYVLVYTVPESVVFVDP